MSLARYSHCQRRRDHFKRHGKTFHVTQKELDAIRPEWSAVRVERVFRDGPDATAIVDTAAEFGADLIVMGTTAHLESAGFSSEAWPRRWSEKRHAQCFLSRSQDRYANSYPSEGAGFMVGVCHGCWCGDLISIFITHPGEVSWQRCVRLYFMVRTRFASRKSRDNLRAGPGEAVIRITLTTICGTDLHILRGEYPVKPGLIIGHEPVGVIEELGAGVTDTNWDRVLVGAITPCGQCHGCLSGHLSQCGHGDGIEAIGGWRFGNTINGAQAEDLLVPANKLGEDPGRANG